MVLDIGNHGGLWLGLIPHFTNVVDRFDIHGHAFVFQSLGYRFKV